MTEAGTFLSTQIASRNPRLLALGTVLMSAAIFIAIAPFAKDQLGRMTAFIPAYESALVTCDLVTAVLLFGQFNFLRTRALLVLACGYLFAGVIAAAHALTFPGAFGPSGVLGGGPQTTAWMYMLWHAGFPLFVVAYALVEKKPPHAGRTGRAIVTSIGAVGATVALLTLAATANIEFLPALIAADSFTVALTSVVSAIWLLSLLALVLLWRQATHTVLDLWLMVVMCAWMFDIALSSVLNGARYDLGWYSGRLYGLLAASFVLVVLLAENAANYARLAHLSSKLEMLNAALELLSMQDPLTGVANRRAFDDHLRRQVSIARRHGRELSLVLLDVDAFKAFNDAHGHPAGDACLAEVAQALRSVCRRPGDMAARYGGEEFALILPDTCAQEAKVIAEAGRLAVCGLRLPHGTSPAFAFVSVSAGVATLADGATFTAPQLLSAADQALYRAKHRGRNQVAGALLAVA